MHKMGGLVLFLSLSRLPLAHFHRSLPLNSVSVLHSDCFTWAITIILGKETKILAVKTSSKIHGALKTKCIKYADHRGHSPIHFKSVTTGTRIIKVSFWYAVLSSFALF